MRRQKINETLGKRNKMKAVRLRGKVLHITPSTICPSMAEIRVGICLNSMKILRLRAMNQAYHIQIYDNDICVIHVIRLFVGIRSCS